MPSLYHFQQEAVDKFTPVPTCLFGDDMGLGKTVESIALDKKRRELHGAKFKEAYRGKPLTLVVAPLSVLGVWRSHFKEWQPSLRVFVIDPKARHAFINAFTKGTHDVFVCHWESLRLMPELRKIHWFHIIADEVHRAKNRKAQQTVALKKLFTMHKTGLSGTPADNAPQDFWSILNWILPRLFSSYWRFYREHVIIKHHDSSGLCGCLKAHKRPYDEILGCANVDELMDQIKPYYIRRLKEEVLPDLPEKYYTKIEVDLTPQQRRVYDEMRRKMLAWVGQHENEPIAAPIVIAQLTRLQQFACAYAKMETVVKRYRDCKACKRDRGLPSCVGHESQVVRLDEPSSKLDVVMQLIEDNPSEQIVVFSQSKQVANLLHARLTTRNITTALFTGDTPFADRDGLEQDFQAGRRRVFVGTIAAGGVGLTLTAASTVIFVDRVWSPSVNRQAEDRLHRISQKNAVQVIDLVAKDTVDAGRLQRIELKWNWVKQILGDKVDEKVFEEV